METLNFDKQETFFFFFVRYSRKLKRYIRGYSVRAYSYIILDGKCIEVKTKISNENESTKKKKKNVITHTLYIFPLTFFVDHYNVNRGMFNLQRFSRLNKKNNKGTFESILQTCNFKRTILEERKKKCKFD